MSTSLVIYLASISASIRFFLTMSGFAILAANAALAFWRAEEKKRFAWPVHIAIAAATAVTFLTVALVPSGDDIYKIAGVTGQQKAQIDAAGKVVSDSAKKAVP